MAAASCLLLMTACAGTGVIPNSTDNSPPALRIGSVNLSPDVLVDSGVDAGAWQGVNVATGASEFLFSATATDQESGIEFVGLAGEVRGWCGGTPGTVNALARVGEPLVARADASSRPDGTRPAQLSTSVSVSLPRIRALCPVGLTLVDYQVDVRAEARNGAGLHESRPTASVVNGPVEIRVAVLNAFAPCLRELENPLGDELSYRVVCESLKVNPAEGNILTGPDRRMSRDSVLDRWGAFFATQDVVLINEISVADVRWLDRMRLFMPGFHMTHRGTTAILTRWPVRDIREDSESDTYNNPGGLPFGVTSDHVRATVEAPGRPLVVYAVHWAHRPAPPESSASRLSFAVRAANDVRALSARTPVLMGGDFNSKSNFIGDAGADLDSADARDEHSRFVALHGGLSMPEVQQIETVLEDARAEMVRNRRLAAYAHQYGWPVDRLYLGGRQYAATAYDNTRGDIATPSDHPMLLFTLRRVMGPVP